MDVRGSVYYPRDAHLEPERLMAALRERASALGVELDWETEVTGWRTVGGRISAVRTSRGPRDADEYVLCAGAWSAAGARELGLRLPLQAGKGYSLTVKTTRLPRLCAILSEAHVAVTPMGDALRVGGTMELGGGLDDEVDPVRVRGIVRSACRYFPDLEAADFEGVTPWCGLRPCSPDGLPYVGRTARLGNLSLATGHAMLGVSLGPITGKLMAEVLSDEDPHLDIRALSPDRYA
jgi:D-amino-acid dehydrogenase